MAQRLFHFFGPQGEKVPEKRGFTSFKHLSMGGGGGEDKEKGRKWGNLNFHYSFIIKERGLWGLVTAKRRGKSLRATNQPLLSTPCPKWNGGREKGGESEICSIRRKGGGDE